MKRNAYLDHISSLLEQFPMICLLGPRQVGKTTLAKMYVESARNKYTHIHHFDLEDPSDLQALENAKLTLSPLEGLVIIDEIQIKPDLFPLLRVLIDNSPNTRRWLILGSASRELLHHSSDTLAGRLAYLEVTPFSYQETHEINNLWWRGGFPGAYLAKTNTASFEWRKQYTKTFLEQDIPNLGIKIPATNLRRFWMMLAHYHGNILNISELSRSLNINANSIRNYLDILTDTFMIRQLQPWWENISKRQIKSPKIYFRDSGLLHYFLDIQEPILLPRHPKVGASWEGFAMEEIIRYHDMDAGNAYFWATQSHAELDLLLFLNSKRIGIEFKYSDAPKLTKSMQIASKDLQLDYIFVIYPGERSYQLDEKILVTNLIEYEINSKNFINS